MGPVERMVRQHCDSFARPETVYFVGHVIAFAPAVRSFGLEHNGIGLLQRASCRVRRRFDWNPSHSIAFRGRGNSLKLLVGGEPCERHRM